MCVCSHTCAPKCIQIYVLYCVWQQNPQANFWFLTKRHAEDERTFAQQCLDVVGDMIRVLMPSSHRVSKILNARVPIVKFHHDITDIECDLSCVNVWVGSNYFILNACLPIVKFHCDITDIKCDLSYVNLWVGSSYFMVSTPGSVYYWLHKCRLTGFRMAYFCQ